jgi:hypothetical protein
MGEWFFRILPEIILKTAGLFWRTSTQLAKQFSHSLTDGGRLQKWTGYLRALRYYLNLTSWSLINLTAWEFFFYDQRTDVKIQLEFKHFIENPRSFIPLFTVTWFFVLLSSVVFLVEKSVLQVFAVGFHKVPLLSHTC